MNERTLPQVGFLGLGLMGSGMAANLRRAGYPVLLWNREPEAYPPLEALGAERAPSPEAAAGASEVVASMLWDDAVSAEILGRRAFEAARPGTLFLEMSTLSPAATRALEGAARERGLRFVAAPVTGSKENARDATLGALASGDAADVEAVRPVLEAMTKTVTYTGAVGTSAYLKLANNQVIAAIAVALAEAVAFARAGGVETEVALDLFIATCARVPAMKRAAILACDLTPHFTLDALAKDVRASLATAQQAGMPLAVVPHLLAYIERAIEAGHGRDDFSSLIDPSRATPS